MTVENPTLLLFLEIQRRAKEDAQYMGVKVEDNVGLSAHFVFTSCLKMLSDYPMNSNLEAIVRASGNNYGDLKHFFRYVDQTDFRDKLLPFGQYIKAQLDQLAAEQRVEIKMMQTAPERTEQMYFPIK